MTVGGDFIPGDGVNSDAPSYPKLFGVSLTPTVVGILLALLGLGAALWLYSTIVQPALQRSQELNQDISAKEQQLLDQQDTQKQIADARNRLQDAQQLRSDVLSLFATEKSTDTLLLDVNERVQAVNAGIQDPKRRATLAKFDFDAGASGPVTDGSLGPAVDNRLTRRVYNVEIDGSFPQTQSIIRNIERLQPLLVITDFVSELDPDSQTIVLNERGRLSPGQAESKVRASFRLSALIPTESPPAPAPSASPSPSPSP